MYEIGWFSTGRDAAARELLRSVHQALEESEISAHIHFVFSNQEPGEDKESDEFFKLVRDLKLKLICFSSAQYKPAMRKKGLHEPETMTMWREEYDRELLRLLTPYQPNIVVLAGYMLIVSNTLVDFYNLINLHPAKPGGPKGTYQQVIWQLIEEQAAESGVTIHLVTNDLDAGPPITYCTFPIRGEGFDHLWSELENDRARGTMEQIKTSKGEAYPLFAEIRRQGVKRELPLLTNTVLELARGNIKLKDEQVFQRGKLCPDGCLVNELIEAALV